ncbi:MAG: transglycosylase SLT domain-containing protein [Chloroflexia bacterium]
MFSSRGLRLWAGLLLLALEACGATWPHLRPSSAASPPASPARPAPPSPANLLLYAESLADDGDYEGAASLYQQVLAEAPGTSEAETALLGLARSYLDMGRPLSATAVLSPTLDALSPEVRHRAYFLLGEGFQAAGGGLQAVRFYRLYREGGTTLGDLIAERLARCYRDLGEHEQAAREFTRAADPIRSLSDQVGMLEAAAWEYRAFSAYDLALARYTRILVRARKPWYRASILYQMGETLQEAGRPDEALARWKEALSSYPATAAAAQAADALLAAGVDVDPYDVARAYQAAGRPRDALVYFAKARLREHLPPDLPYETAQARADAGDLDGALAELEDLARSRPTDPRPLEEQARLLEEAYLPEAAVEAYRRLQGRFPQTEAARKAAWQAARLLEEMGRLDEAAAGYLAFLEQFPDSPEASEARFHAGLLRYRQGRYLEAAAVWAGEPEPRGTPSPAPTRALFWQGIALERAGRGAEARRAWERASAGTGYYAARAREYLSQEAGFGDYREEIVLQEPPEERSAAEAWLSRHFGRPVSAELPAVLRDDPLFRRGEEFLSLGRADEAREPFAMLVQRFRYHGPALYALSLYFRARHLPALSIACAERLLELADVREEEAPRFLLRLLYPTPYAHLILPAARSNGLDPLLFFALVRQESRFDRYATSWAEARGLTQVIPSTGRGIAEQLGWTPFRLEDLYRPFLSVRFGTWYLGRQQEAFSGQAIPALAAYNGGPGNAQRWAGFVTPVSDLDLFVESVDLAETRDYIERIYTSYWVYRRLYAGSEDG